MAFRSVRVGQRSLVASCDQRNRTSEPLQTPLQEAVPEIEHSDQKALLAPYVTGRRD